MYGVITDPNNDFPIFKWVKLNNHINVQKVKVWVDICIYVGYLVSTSNLSPFSQSLSSQCLHSRPKYKYTFPKVRKCLSTILSHNASKYFVVCMIVNNPYCYMIFHKV